MTQYLDYLKVLDSNWNHPSRRSLESGDVIDTSVIYRSSSFRMQKNQPKFTCRSSNEDCNWFLNWFLNLVQYKPLFEWCDDFRTDRHSSDPHGDHHVLRTMPARLQCRWWRRSVNGDTSPNTIRVFTTKTVSLKPFQQDLSKLLNQHQVPRHSRGAFKMHLLIQQR